MDLHHSQRSYHRRKPDISAILKLIDAPVHTLATQYHYMESLKRQHNCQISCDESDQLVYKLSKDLQWRFLDRFGPEKYFCLFGSFHIEKALLLLCGSLIEGSGLGKVIASCELSIVGTDSLPCSLS